MKKTELKELLAEAVDIICDLTVKIEELKTEVSRVQKEKLKVGMYTENLMQKYCNLEKRCAVSIRKCYTDGKTTTAVVWSDGSVTKAKCGKGETFDAEKGFLACVAKRALSSKQYSTVIGSRKDFPIINSGSESPEIAVKSKKIPEEVLEKALKDHLNGLTYADAASKYGISRTTLVKYASKKR